MEDEVANNMTQPELSKPIFMGNPTEEEKKSMLEASAKNAQGLLNMIAHKKNLGKSEEEPLKDNEPIPKEVLVLQQDAKVKLTSANEKTQHFNNILKRKNFRDKLVNVPGKVEEALSAFKYYPTLKDEGSVELNEKKASIFECPIEKIESIHPDLVKDYMNDIISTYPTMTDMDLEYVKYPRKTDGVFVISRVLSEKEGFVLSEEPLFYIDPKNSMFDTSHKNDPKDPFAVLRNRFVEEQLEKNPSLKVEKNEYGNLDIVVEPQIMKDSVFGGSNSEKEPEKEPETMHASTTPVLSSLLKKRPPPRTAFRKEEEEKEEDKKDLQQKSDSDKEDSDNTVMEIRFRGAHIIIKNDKTKQ